MDEVAIRSYLLLLGRMMGPDTHYAVATLDALLAIHKAWSNQ